VVCERIREFRLPGLRCGQSPAQCMAGDAVDRGFAVVGSGFVVADSMKTQSYRVLSRDMRRGVTCRPWLSRT
jgi:hypothetical protein